MNQVHLPSVNQKPPKDTMRHRSQQSRQSVKHDKTVQQIQSFEISSASQLVRSQISLINELQITPTATPLKFTGSKDSGCQLETNVQMNMGVSQIKNKNKRIQGSSMCQFQQLLQIKLKQPQIGTQADKNDLKPNVHNNIINFNSKVNNKTKEVTSRSIERSKNKSKDKQKFLKSKNKNKQLKLQNSESCLLDSTLKSLSKNQDQKQNINASNIIKRADSTKEVGKAATNLRPAQQKQQDEQAINRYIDQISKQKQEYKLMYKQLSKDSINISQSHMNVENISISKSSKEIILQAEIIQLQMKCSVLMGIVHKLNKEMVNSDGASQSNINEILNNILNKQLSHSQKLKSSDSVNISRSIANDKSFNASRNKCMKIDQNQSSFQLNTSQITNSIIKPSAELSQMSQLSQIQQGPQVHENQESLTSQIYKQEMQYFSYIQNYLKSYREQLSTYQSQIKQMQDRYVQKFNNMQAQINNKQSELTTKSKELQSQRKINYQMVKKNQQLILQLERLTQQKQKKVSKFLTEQTPPIKQSLSKNKRIHQFRTITDQGSEYSSSINRTPQNRQQNNHFCRYSPPEQLDISINTKYSHMYRHPKVAKLEPQCQLQQSYSLRQYQECLKQMQTIIEKLVRNLQNQLRNKDILLGQINRLCDCIKKSESQIMGKNNKIYELQKQLLLGKAQQIKKSKISKQTLSQSSSSVQNFNYNRHACPNPQNHSRNKMPKQGEYLMRQSIRSQQKQQMCCRNSLEQHHSMRNSANQANRKYMNQNSRGKQSQMGSSYPSTNIYGNLSPILNRNMVKSKGHENPYNQYYSNRNQFSHTQNGYQLNKPRPSLSGVPHLQYQQQVNRNQRVNSPKNSLPISSK